jgi:hypothetical protein
VFSGCGGSFFSRCRVRQKPRRFLSLGAWHRAGQTFLTWTEVMNPVTQDNISVQELKNIQTRIEQATRVRFRIYRSNQPIRSVRGLKPIAEVPPFSAWNTGIILTTPGTFVAIPKKTSLFLLFRMAKTTQPLVGNRLLNSYALSTRHDSRTCSRGDRNGWTNTSLHSNRTIQSGSPIGQLQP